MNLPNSPIISTVDSVALSVRLFVMGIFGFFWFNFLWGPWINATYPPIPWTFSINPIADFLFLRTGGPILYANHVSSALAIMTTTTYFLIKTKKIISSIFVIFSTVSIHEFTLDFLNVPLMIVHNSLGYTITLKWFFWLSFFLIPGLILANKNQRRAQVRIFVFCLCFIGAWTVGAQVFEINTYTIIATSPGPAFLSAIPNAFEVASWLGACAMWFV